jgi:hypothetical protein
MKPRCVSKHIKLIEYITMIKHILLYGCGTWAMTQQMKSYLKNGRDI